MMTANFVWFETGMANEEFKEFMAARGVKAARAFPPMETWSRMSIGLPEEMAAAHKALEELYAGVEEVGAEAGAGATAAKL